MDEQSPVAWLVAYNVADPYLVPRDRTDQDDVAVKEERQHAAAAGP
jgi:hypothetical protein